MPDQPGRRRVLGAAAPVAVADTPWTLIVNGYCHLCEEMRQALRPYGLVWRELDIDAHPELEERWGEWVPVLIHGDTEVCHYHLDVNRLQPWLQPVAGRSDPPCGG